METAHRAVLFKETTEKSQTAVYAEFLYMYM